MEQEAGVTMRLIGHEILLSLGDSTSKVMPVKREGNRFQISFENELAFEPSRLVYRVDSVMIATGFSNHYIVEIQECGKTEIVHSYEYNPSANSLLPCGGREYPKSCYELYITDLAGTFYAEEAKETLSNGVLLWMLPLALLLSGVLAYFRKSNKKSLPEHIIPLGEYLFDERAMSLKRDGEETELTGKEVDLLKLLHQNVNETIERDILLNKVWGDEGDYVGRTLDVFISKLRKKLELDTTIKIANVRGVGYKLILPVE